MSSPLTNQVVVALAGKLVTGVQVSTVFAGFHDGVVGTRLKAGPKKSASVASGFIAVLKVKTTVVCGETPVAPVAGTVESRIVWALARSKQLKTAMQIITRSKRLIGPFPSEFITRIQLLGTCVVTRKELTVFANVKAKEVFQSKLAAFGTGECFQLALDKELPPAAMVEEAILLMSDSSF